MASRSRRATRAGWAAAAIFVATNALFVVGLVLLVIAGSLPAPVAVLFATEMALPFVGLFIVLRTGNRVGWIFLLVGLGLSILASASGYAEYGLVERPGSLPAAVVVAWIAELVWLPHLVLGTMFLFLLFPDGHLPSRRWRFAAFLGIGGATLIEASIVFEPTLYAYPDVGAPLAGVLPTSVVEAAANVGGLMLLPAMVLALVSLGVRYRRAERVGRQQIKLFAYAAVAFFASELAFNVFELARDNAVLSMIEAPTALLIPAAVTVAILKYRLYDIDLVINRTLVYGSLTAILAGAYFGLVALFQTILAPLTEGSDLAVVASTLAVAALFRPARARIQRFIDRRFYRSRYDATKTLESFAARLRDEVELPALTADLLRVVRETLQPAHASLWLRAEEQP